MRDLATGIKVPMRCLVTGNPPGTDTVMVGHPCTCQVCQAADRIEALEAALKADCDAQAKADLVAENERLQRDLAEERAKHALTFQHVQSDTGHRGQ